MMSDMTLSPRSNGEVLNYIFKCFNTLQYHDDLCQKLRNCVYICQSYA